VIVSALLSLVGSVFSLIGVLLPDVGVVPWIDTVASFVDEAAEGLGAMAGPLDHFVPITEMLTAFSFVIAVWGPAMLAFLIARWVWGHVPQIGGK